MTNKEADIATPADFAYMNAYKAAPPGFAQGVQAVAASCGSR